ncbi:MAG: NADH:flavin oxidoreductase, partial [Dehalococcoidales bacterium]
NGQAARGQYGAHNDDMIHGLSRMAEAVHRGGTKIALQIVHSGINSAYLASKGETLLAVSRMPSVNREHREMTGEEIEAIIADFGAAAVRAREAGFDAVQLHGAHGYLMSQFLSPLYNRRNDRWGGTSDNRERFHLEVVKKVRSAIGTDFPLLIKFGVQDDRERGLPLSDGLQTAKGMEAEGLDAIEVSAGIGTSSQVIREGEAERPYFRERAAAVKKAVNIPVMVVGGIRSLTTVRDIVASGDADMVSLCRPFIREPGLVARWQNGDEAPARCISCNRCMAILQRGEPLECGEERRLREEAAAGT